MGVGQAFWGTALDSRWVLSLLHVLVLALMLVVVVAWGRGGSRRRLVVSGLLSVSVTIVAYVRMVHPGDIPIAWITILSHGLEGKSIMHLYGRGLNVGMDFDFVLGAVAGGAPTVRDAVWLNLLLAGIDALIFFHIALYVTGPLWAVVWTLVFALNPAMFLASFSELPTHLLALYFLLGVLGWAAAVDEQPRPAVLRAAAYLACAVLTLLVALVRLEVALIGVVALALQAGYALCGARRWSAATRRLLDACERPLAFLSDHPGVVAALGVLGIVLSWTGLPWLLGRGETSGLYPFNPSFLSLFGYLPLLALPIGTSIAVLFGFVAAIERFRWFGGLALSLFILVRMYFAVWLEYFEMGRYLSYVLPAIFLVGLFGRDELDRLASGWSPGWRRAVHVGYLLAWFTLPLPGVVEYYARPEYVRGGGFAQLLLDRDVQREARYLVGLVEQHPECVYVARVVEDRFSVIDNATHGGGDPKIGPEYAYVVFGASVPEPIWVGEHESSLADVVSRVAPDRACVRLYYGGDCNLTFTDRCAAFVAGRRRIDEQRFWARPYNNPLQLGYGAPEIVLATYAWP